MPNDVMDSGERAEAALAAFSGDGENADTSAQGGERPADGTEGQPHADQANARVQEGAEAQPAEGQLTDEQLQADPRFQELSTLKDSVVNALSDFPGLVDANGAPNLQEASLQLKDASVLYDIMQGKGAPSALLETMAANAGWSDGQKQQVAQDLIQWLTKSGYLKDGQGAAAKKAGDPGFKDPIAERLDRIENERKSEAQRQEQQRVQAHQQEVFNKHFLPTIEKLCAQKGVPKEDFNDYVGRVAEMVKGNKAVIDRIEKGNYVDLQKFFTQVYNAEALRMQRWTKAQTAAADKKNKNPHIPAGGAPPNPAGSAKTMNPKDRDSRIAAAVELL